MADVEQKKDDKITLEQRIKNIEKLVKDPLFIEIIKQMDGAYVDIAKGLAEKGVDNASPKELRAVRSSIDKMRDVIDGIAGIFVDETMKFGTLDLALKVELDERAADAKAAPTPMGTK